LQKKEQRWTTTTQRLRERVEQLEQENGELKEEIRILERKRMESMQKEVIMT
jgi:centromere protein J